LWFVIASYLFQIHDTRTIEMRRSFSVRNSEPHQRINNNEDVDEGGKSRYKKDRSHEPMPPSSGISTRQRPSSISRLSVPGGSKGNPGGTANVDRRSRSSIEMKRSATPLPKAEAVSRLKKSLEGLKLNTRMDYMTP